MSGQVEREAVGVVQAEGVGAGDRPVRPRGGDVVEDAHARIQRLGEAFLLGLERALGGGAAFAQHRVGFAHLPVERADQLVEERFAHAQHPAVAQIARRMIRRST